MVSDTHRNRDVRIDEVGSDEEIDAVRDLMRKFVAWHYERHHQFRALIDSYFDSASFEDELARLPEPFVPPEGHLLVAKGGEKVLGIVALRRLATEVCEMKRLFVHPSEHGRGIGRALAEAIIDRARGDGYRIMRLDTGPLQKEALGLYDNLGFEPIPPYYDVPTEMKDWLHYRELRL